MEIVLTKEHIDELKSVEDGATIYGYINAKLLREVQRFNNKLIQILDIAELEKILNKEFDGAKQLPYFGAILTNKGKTFVKRMNRLLAVNELLRFIAETDKDRHHPFFGHYKNNRLKTGQFVFTETGYLYYNDPYTDRNLRVCRNSRQLQYHCGEGGTGQEIISQLGEFIMHGKQGFLNDYKEVWGWNYENTMKVREKALEIGFIKTVNYPYKRWAVVEN